ncbi:uncharacterized protein LOC126823288 isoform X2 [Patella vulgata]|uniref:uncharacterized protein LOC126823288 isoform X2 n=1 Tax=Patella vulgata TaxID=6465 RepID=UPI00217FEDDF|nr:uncharacterized protein LOC126823288 isoform X2 [Patella vulgata]
MRYMLFQRSCRLIIDCKTKSHAERSFQTFARANSNCHLLLRNVIVAGRNNNTVTGINFNTCSYFLKTKYQTNNPKHLKSSKMSNHRPTDRTKSGWADFEKYSVFARSISGLETSVVVKSDDLSLAFDMGYSAKESVKCKNVFISKISGNPRALNEIEILPCGDHDTVNFTSKYTMKAFPTIHRVKSQGYILYHHKKSLKAEYQDLDGKTIGEMVKSGETIHDIITTPDVAFTGDTTFDIFKNVTNPDLLRVKILIAESTYIDKEPNKDMIKLAQDRGHTHLQEFIDNEHLFRDIQHIVLIHFSDKYSSNYIKRVVYSSLPDSLIDKVVVSTYAKDIP